MNNESEIANRTNGAITFDPLIKRMEDFTSILNEEPLKEKIQKHQGYEYIPISVIEKDLDRIYSGLVQYECISYCQIFNEIACHARIKVFHPVIMQWMSYDGLGSAVIQQDSGTKVIDFSNYKKANALQLTLPKSYAEAIKNAAKKIGKRFGADVNRKFEDEYTPFSESLTESKEIPKEKIESIPVEVCDYISMAETTENLTAIYNEYKHLQSNKEFMKKLSEKKNQIQKK